MYLRTFEGTNYEDTRITMHYTYVYTYNGTRTVHVLYAAQFFCIRYCKRTRLPLKVRKYFHTNYESTRVRCSLLARDMICIMTSERAIINNIALQLTVDRLTIISSYLKVASYEGMKLASY